MQISNNIYKSNNSPFKNLRENYQKTYLPSFQTDTFIASKENKSNIKEVNFGGTIHHLKANPLERIFRELYEFNGDNIDFAQFAFNRLKKHLELDGVLPKNILVIDDPDGKRAAAFRWRTGEFIIDEKYCQESNKGSIINSIRHELEHYLQYEKIVRAKDIGPEKLIKLDAEKELEYYKGDFFEAQIPEEHLPEEPYRSDANFIKVLSNAVDKKFWQKVRRKRGVIKPGTADAQRALRYLNAFLAYPRKDNYAQNFCRTHNITYTVPEGFASMYKKHKYHYLYVTNPLEVDAYKVGNDIQEQYLEFESRTTGKPRSINKELIEVQRMDQIQLDAIKQFDEVFEEKFGEYNLPDDFKGYMYFHVMGNENSTNQDMLDIIKAIPQNMKKMEKPAILKLLKLYEFVLSEDVVRLRSQEEIDSVSKFIQKYRAANT